MMETIQVTHGAGAYDVHIMPGILQQAGVLLRNALREVSSIFIVTDSNVATHYLASLEASLLDAGYTTHKLVLPPGEETKSAAWLLAVYNAFAEAGLHREDLVLALGGGVVGDLAGYAAATWMRGVAFAQVPTTLLAQVDASLGGKTAINLPYGKNLVGAFHQPRLVLCDPLCLDTLPAREYRSGMAEVIKYGVTHSLSLFEALETSVPPPMNIIPACCRIKAAIVSIDAHDHGPRKTLNFGHTFGHAIEMTDGPGLYTHGESVSIGMSFAARLGEIMGITEPGTADRLRRALTFHGLPCDLPYSPESLLTRALSDKKAVQGGIELLLLQRVGEVICHAVTLDTLQNAFEAL